SWDIMFIFRRYSKPTAPGVNTLNFQFAMSPTGQSRCAFCVNMEGTIKIALVGAGMFGGDVHARTYADLQRAGIGPQLGRVGLDHWARDFAPLKFQLVALATRTEKSARRAQKNFKHWTGEKPNIYFGQKPWLEIFRDFPDLDVTAVATPDHLHTEVILAALNAATHVITEKPMCLDIAEADRIIELAKKKNRI